MNMFRNSFLHPSLPGFISKAPVFVMILLINATAIHAQHMAFTKHIELPDPKLPDSRAWSNAKQVVFIVLRNCDNEPRAVHLLRDHKLMNEYVVCMCREAVVDARQFGDDQRTESWMCRIMGVDMPDPVRLGQLCQIDRFWENPESAKK